MQHSSIHQQQKKKKKGKKRPANERRKTRSEAWLQRRTVSRPDLVSTAATAASALEEIG